MTCGLDFSVGWLLRCVWERAYSFKHGDARVHCHLLFSSLSFTTQGVVTPRRVSVFFLARKYSCSCGLGYRVWLDQLPQIKHYRNNVQQCCIHSVFFLWFFTVGLVADGATRAAKMQRKRWLRPCLKRERMTLHMELAASPATQRAAR